MIELAQKLSTGFIVIVIIYAIVKNVIIINKCIEDKGTVVRSIVSYVCISEEK